MFRTALAILFAFTMVTVVGFVALVRQVGKGDLAGALELTSALFFFLALFTASCTGGIILSGVGPNATPSLIVAGATLLALALACIFLGFHGEAHGLARLAGGLGLAALGLLLGWLWGRRLRVRSTAGILVWLCLACLVVLLIVLFSPAAA